MSLPIWAWIWTAWPLFDRNVFDRDVERIERWYRARGFYEANVTGTAFTPPLNLQAPPDQRLRIDIRVAEGEPVIVRSVEIRGLQDLPEDLANEVRSAVTLRVGARFDESDIDLTKVELATHLRNGSYAHAAVQAEARVDPEARIADVMFEIESGPRCRFGRVRIYVEGDDADGIPGATVLATTLIRRGDPYSQQAIADAQRALFALGTFSTVEIAPDFTSNEDLVDVDVRLRTGRMFRAQIGVGLQEGDAERMDPQNPKPRQWDVHILGALEHRNLFGGMERGRMELRPRVVFRNPFPAVDPVTLGLEANASLSIPALLEARTSLDFSARYNVGPDPFGQSFDRHELVISVGPRRNFFDQRLTASATVNTYIFSPFRFERPRECAVPSPDCDSVLARQPAENSVLFLEETIALDLRDPRGRDFGAFFQVSSQQAAFLSWSYIRFTPEIRLLFPLPFGVTIATRFALGLMEILSTTLDPNTPLGELGPERYRLRGGGPTSNRGFRSGELGDGPTGGVRRWEASLELRWRLTSWFSLVAFGDVGDVSRTRDFRWNNPQLTVGGGFRFHLESIGIIRVDLAGRVHDFQGPFAQQRSDVDLGFARFPGAFHITFGEAF